MLNAKGQPFSYRCAKAHKACLRRPNSAKILAMKPQQPNQTTHRSTQYSMCNTSQKYAIRKMLKNTQLLNTLRMALLVQSYSYTDARCTRGGAGCGVTAREPFCTLWMSTQFTTRSRVQSLLDTAGMSQQ